MLAKYYDQKIKSDVLDRYLEVELDRLVGPPYSGPGSVVVIIQILGQQGTKSSLRVLEKASTHSHGDVRREAEKASAQIRLRK